VQSAGLAEKSHPGIGPEGEHSEGTFQPHNASHRRTLEASTDTSVESGLLVLNLNRHFYVPMLGFPNLLAFLRISLLL